MIFVPLADSGTSWRRTPWLWALMTANVVVMILALLRRESEVFILAGALYPSNPVPWAFVTSAFLHVSIGHLVGNLIFLWGFGQPIHHRLGARLFLLVYAITGVAAGVAFVLSGEDLPVVGASGAISGLMGLYVVLWPRRQMRIAYWIGKGGVLRPRAMWAVGLWIALQVWMSTRDDGTESVAYAAHLGGFAAGAIAGLVLRRAVAEGPRRAWMLESPDPEHEVHAGHLARAVVHNAQVGAAEPMARAWDDWAGGPAHVGFSQTDLERVQWDFARRSDLRRAADVEVWRGLIHGERT